MWWNNKKKKPKQLWSNKTLDSIEKLKRLERKIVTGCNVERLEPEMNNVALQDAIDGAVRAYRETQSDDILRGLERMIELQSHRAELSFAVSKSVDSL